MSAFPSRSLRARANGPSSGFASFIAPIGLVLACVATVLLAQHASVPPATAVAVVGAAAAAAWFLLTQRTGLALALFMVYLACGDGPLKLLTNNYTFTLARDAMLLLIVAGVLARGAIERRSFGRPQFLGWVVVFAVLAVAELANPNGAGAKSDLAGLRQQIEWIPLFFFGFTLLRTPQRVGGFFGVLLLVAAINGVVGVLQFNLTPDQLASWGPGYYDRVYGTGLVPGARFFVDAAGAARVRPFGLGPDTGFAGILGMCAIPAGVALLIQARTLRARLLVAAGLGGTFAGVLTSQSRAAFVTTALVLIVFLALALSGRRRRGAIVVLTTVTIGIGSVVFLAVSGSGTTGFRSVQSVAPSKLLGTTRKERGGSLGLIGRYASTYPLGAGLGHTGPAASQLPNPTEVLNGESEFNFLTVEMGLPGLLLMMMFTLRLGFAGATTVPRIKDTRTHLYLAAAVAPLFGIAALWFLGAVTASTPGGPYFWFIAGVLAWWAPRGRRHAVSTPRTASRERGPAREAPALA